MTTHFHMFYPLEHSFVHFHPSPSIFIHHHHHPFSSITIPSSTSPSSFIHLHPFSSIHIYFQAYSSITTQHYILSYILWLAPIPMDSKHIMPCIVLWYCECYCIVTDIRVCYCYCLCYVTVLQRDHCWFLESVSD